MKEIILDENGNPIQNSVNYENKRKEIEKELSERLFDKIGHEDIYEEKVDQQGNLIKKKRKVSKNEICPAISATRVQSVLESILRLYKPMSILEAKELEPEEYLKAYSEYSKLVDYINEYIPFRSIKQNYCSFTGLLVDDFETLMSDQEYGNTFKWIRDGFAGNNFTDASSGLYDSRAIITESQTRGDGLNMVKNPEQINYNTYNTLNYSEIEKQLALYEGMLPQTPKKLPKKEK